MPKALRSHLGENGRLVRKGAEVTGSPAHISALQARGLVERGRSGSSAPRQPAQGEDPRRESFWRGRSDCSSETVRRDRPKCRKP